MTRTTVTVIISILLLASLGVIYYMHTSNKEPSTIVSRTTPIKIVAFGDSLTAGYGVAENDNYPSQLQRVLTTAGYRIEMVNLGVSGDTTQDAKGRLQQVIDQNPDVVLLGIGGNDALRSMSVQDAEANIGYIIEKLKSLPKPPLIVLLQMQASINAGLEYKRNFDAIYEDVAKKYDLPLVPFIVTKIYLDKKYMLDDRIHMNKEGYAYVINEYLKDAVIDELKKLK